MRKMLLVWAILGCSAIMSGCAHTQLRWNTTHQARTLTDIYEQQVLDNLARFVHDSNSLPSFAYANAGGASVADSGNASSNTGWNVAGFSSQSLGFSAGRNMNESWTLQPVSDVRRLELMRCAYQISMQNAGLNSHGSNCPDCDRMMRAFYLGGPTEDYRSAEEKKACMPDELSTWTARMGRTTPACFGYGPWLGTGGRKCVPKGDCVKKAHYCGTHIWVAPGGQDELTKLTLVILDFAISAQAVRPAGLTKEVIWYFNKDGKPGLKAIASQEIRAVFPFDADVRLGNPSAKLPADATNEQRIEAERIEAERNQFNQQFEDALRKQPRNELPPIMPNATPFNPLQFQMYQDFLTPPRNP